MSKYGSKPLGLLDAETPGLVPFAFNAGVLNDWTNR
jgi:hypothetical protein